jgi:hypothetical protein
VADIQVEVEDETDLGEGWQFVVAVTSAGVDANGRSEPDDHDHPVSVRRFRVSLSWMDYDFWCGGSRRPESVVADVVRLVIDRIGLDRLPERFDTATVRRWIRDADHVLRGEDDR